MNTNRLLMNGFTLTVPQIKAFMVIFMIAMTIGRKQAQLEQLHVTE